MRAPKFIGVHSLSSKKSHDGSNTLFFVWEQQNEGYIVQKLNNAFLPTEDAYRIDDTHFKNNFILEPSILAVPITSLNIRNLPPLPKKQEANELLRKLEAQRIEKQTEIKLRDSFRKAMLGLKRPKEQQSSIDKLENIADSQENISFAHKHVFRDFSVKLRKNSMPALALRFGKRVLELSPEDDHAMFNIARILCSMEEYDEAIKYIEKAIAIDGNEKIYTKLLSFINKEKKRNPYKRKKR